MFRAHVFGGKVILPPRLLQWARQNEGAHLDIEHVKPARSISQLRMYRAWLSRLADHTGNDEDELHEFLLDRCAPSIIVTIKGPKGTIDVTQKKRTHGGDKNTMTKAEFTEYMDNCAALTDFPLPTREELEEMGYIIA
jgi:hypothetical protein